MLYKTLHGESSLQPISLDSSVEVYIEIPVEIIKKLTYRVTHPQC